VTSLRLGLTGGIGSGKSTVAAILQRLGAPVIDADAISRASTASNGSAIAAIAQAFGPAVLTLDHALDRDAMRERVFADPSAKAMLEGIVHPLVGQEIERLTQAYTEDAAPCIVYDIPLLVESTRWRKILDRVLVVDCQESTQIQRVAQRNGLTADAVQQIIAAQAPRALRLAAADAVIYNDQVDLPALERMVCLLATDFGL
jgi:dephospho-CoA kinase